MRPEIIGAYYAFCRDCGGWVAWHAVFSEPHRKVVVHRHGTERIASHRQLEDEFIRNHQAQGRPVEFYGMQDKPGRCDCFRPLFDWWTCPYCAAGVIGDTDCSRCGGTGDITLRDLDQKSKHVWSH